MKFKTVIIPLIIILCIMFTFKVYALLTTETKAKKFEAEISFENVYSDCSHTESYTSPVKESFDSLDELQATYPSWKIKNFDENKICLTKNNSGYCNNHYQIKLNGNKITVTRLKNKSVYKEFYISLKYLTDTDIAELEKGKTVNSKQELTEFIEDFTS